MLSVKTGERRDIDVIFGIVNEENDERANSAHLLPQIEDENMLERKRGAVA